MTRLILYNIQYLEGTTGKVIDYAKFWHRVSHPKGIDKTMAQKLNFYKPDIVAFVEMGGGSFLDKKNYVEFFKSGVEQSGVLARPISERECSHSSAFRKDANA